MNLQILLEQASRARVRLTALALLVAVLALLYARFAWLSNINHDEVEHAHVGFKIAQGLVPYRDFYQNHTPAYWLLSTQFVRAFPFSVDVILAGRAVSMLAFLGCWLIGLRLLALMPAGRAWFSRLVYSWAVIVLAYHFEWSLARPDALMTFFATAALCLVPARGWIPEGRALVMGVLMGLAVSLSPRVLPLVLVIPVLVTGLCLWCHQPGRLRALLFYGLGTVLAVLPTVYWLFHHGLVEAFRFDVLDLNRALSKPWHRSFGYLHASVYVLGALGVLAWLARGHRFWRGAINALWLLVLWFAAGILLGFLTRHMADYNWQLMTIPVAIGTTGLVTTLWTHTRGRGFRVLLLVALLGFPTLLVVSPLARLHGHGSVSQRDLQTLIDMVRPGERTCTALSPWHPIFCTDVSGLSNEWDNIFPRLVRDPVQLERFNRLWSDGVRRTVEERPDLIVRKGSWDAWQRSVEAGMLTQEELSRLDALEPDYEGVRFHYAVVWLRRPR